MTDVTKKDIIVLPRQRYVYTRLATDPKTLPPVSLQFCKVEVHKDEISEVVRAIRKNSFQPIIIVKDLNKEEIVAIPLEIIQDVNACQDQELLDGLSYLSSLAGFDIVSSTIHTKP